MKNWIVCTGAGCEYRGAFATIEEAFTFIATSVVRPRGQRNFEWRCQMDNRGEVDYYFWRCPTRRQTREEMEEVFARGDMPKVSSQRKENIIRGWLEGHASVVDFRTAEEGVEFPRGPVSSVYISTIQRERQYLIRSDSAGNDNRSRWVAFEDLVAEGV